MRRLKRVQAKSLANERPQFMTGVDTSILIRYLTQDDPARSPRASKIIETLTEEAPGFVSLVVIAEVAWVLRARYKATRLEIADAIDRILSIDSLKVQNDQQVYQAVVAVKEGEGTLADALICAIGSSAGCSRTLTFDSRSHIPHFELA
jgi:predicted nucleic-acid-binding protein